ncbi:hypothetical protein CYLTODRAFT_436819 [Cylindrobasidium torrendii FP15055 ss-10]|uniref:Macrofage activating glyco protein n=1 Tax=Cylindrobasidium torrendii FP15055 ss-10 TaxID=1314674 RepID=A0A0D7BBF1_9AGAR|nr:hypothetical protein CYLTODRAFT_436819 [Cylindrobasidium torrendii FP15055 ss-10]
MFSLSIFLVGLAASVHAQQVTEGVIATGTMGVTNPPKATMGTDVNQESESRLASINSWEDWCLFAPKDAGSTIGDVEHSVVAWCTKPRNNARVIPDGVITGVSFIKTDYYVQVMAYGDFTKLNIQDGDYGGELDPHGPTGDGNPVGGNVTSNVVDGNTDVSYEEWMSFISYQQVCLRVCTNANSTWGADLMCEHELDVMGCEFVMPGNYQFDGKFEECEAEVAYPPGVYVTAIDGTSTGYSTFRQYYTGVYTADGTPVSYTVGTTVTPSSVQMKPSSSNCQTHSTITNGVGLSVGDSQPTGSAASGSSGSSSTRGGSSGSATTTRSGSGSSATSGESQDGGEGDGASALQAVTFFALAAGAAAVALFH